jgi:hypothetical protein
VWPREWLYLLSHVTKGKKHIELEKLIVGELYQQLKQVKDNTHSNFLTCNYYFVFIVVVIPPLRVSKNFGNAHMSIPYHFTRKWVKYISQFYRYLEDSLLGWR